jgi:DNA-binding NarL/FixJ family response regulator
MKKMQYTYNFEPEMYNYILSSNILNKKKHEDKIFKKLVQGYNCKEIGKKIHYSERTIQTRRKDIYFKTKKYMA